MNFLRVSLVIALMSFQSACAADVEPIEKKPVISLRKGSFSSLQKAELFEDNQLQRSEWTHPDEETTVQIEQLREGAFIAARDYLLKNPIPDNPEDGIIECDLFTVVEYIAIDETGEGYSTLCTYQPLEDLYRNIEKIILGFSNNNHKGNLFP